MQCVATTYSPKHSFRLYSERFVQNDSSELNHTRHKTNSATRQYSWNYIFDNCYIVKNLVWEQSTLADYQQLIENYRKIQQFASFQYNWNGYGSPPFSGELIHKATRLLYTVDYQPEVFPIPGGAIQFEYDRDDGSYIEFEIDDTQVIHCYEEEPDGTSREYDIDAESLNSVLRDFYGR